VRERAGVTFEAFGETVKALIGIDAFLKIQDTLPETGKVKTVNSKGYNVTLASKRGNRLSYTLRRLKRDRPDLAQKVVTEEMSANAAAIEAGFRKKYLSIPIDPKRAAASIKRHFEPEQIKELIDYLTD
jgi:hypothetical protein